MHIMNNIMHAFVMNPVLRLSKLHIHKCVKKTNKQKT